MAGWIKAPGLKTAGVWLAGAASLTLAACDGGAADVASPGVGAFPPPPPPPPVVVPPPPPTPGETVPAPAGSCPAGANFSDAGTITVPGGEQRVCSISGTFTNTVNLPRIPGVVYSLSGRVNVGVDLGTDLARPGGQRGQLIVNPGVRVFGSSGSDFLVVNRGSEIVANGTAEAPIIFTGRDDIQGNANQDRLGQFGGLVILGRGPINNCLAAGALPGTVQCESNTEGLTALHGGADAGDSSGTLNFVRVQFAGFEVVPNRELNGITLAGVGSGTTLTNIQVHRGADDGVEFFGGTANIRNLVITDADDDSIDWDTGWRGAIQFAIALQRGGGASDRGIEGSSAGANAAAPAGRNTVGNVANFTFVLQPGTGSNDAITLNSGTDANLLNGIVTGKAACVDIDGNETAAAAPTFNSIFFSCPATVRDDTDINGAATLPFITGGQNNTLLGVSTLIDFFIRGSNESAVVPATAAQLSAASGFFQVVPYIGAVRDAADTRFRNWTCNLYAGGPTC